MNPDLIKSNLLLLTTAAIWGFAFVAQRVGMEYVGPFTFNGVRFALGALSLLPLLFISREKRTAAENILPRPGLKLIVGGGFLAGLLLFAGASLQGLHHCRESRVYYRSLCSHCAHIGALLGSIQQRRELGGSGLGRRRTLFTECDRAIYLRVRRPA